jgi:hypothetical protein
MLIDKLTQCVGRCVGPCGKVQEYQHPESQIIFAIYLLLKNLINTANAQFPEF